MLLEDCSNSLRGDKCIHSLSRSNRGMKSGHRKERGRGKGRERERQRTSRDTGLESVPVGIARIERSQERARDPCQKTINTNFANSYTLPERRIALIVQSAHILRLPRETRLMATNDRHPSSHVCVDCCAHVRLFYLPTSPALPCQSPPLLPFPISLNPRGFMTLDGAENATIEITRGS